MANVNPLLLVGAVIGVVTALLVLACALVKDKKETMGFCAAWPGTPSRTWRNSSLCCF